MFRLLILEYVKLRILLMNLQKYSCYNMIYFQRNKIHLLSLCIF